MDVLSSFISILCHSDWLFHRESCPRVDVVYPGRAWFSSPACTWHCSCIISFSRRLSTTDIKLPYLPLLSSHRASPHFGRYSFSVPLKALRVGGYYYYYYYYYIRPLYRTTCVSRYPQFKNWRFC